jgi:hypothetical protein
VQELLQLLRPEIRRCAGGRTQGMPYAERRT